MVTVTELNRAPDGRFEALEATEAIGNATYPTKSNVPSGLPEGTQVYIADENTVYIEDGT